MTDQAMSPLHRRMIEDMSIRKFTPGTQHTCVRFVKEFSIFFGWKPGDLGNDAKADKPAEQATPPKQPKPRNQTKPKNRSKPTKQIRTRKPPQVRKQRKPADTRPLCRVQRWRSAVAPSSAPVASPVLGEPAAVRTRPQFSP